MKAIITFTQVQVEIEVDERAALPALADVAQSLYVAVRGRLKRFTVNARAVAEMTTPRLRLERDGETVEVDDTGTRRC